MLIKKKKNMCYVVRHTFYTYHFLNCLSKDGPTSQHDTIELRGFEDPPSDKTKKKKSKPSK